MVLASSRFSLLFFYFKKKRMSPLTHHLPALFSGDGFFASAYGLLCWLVVANSKSRWAEKQEANTAKKPLMVGSKLFKQTSLKLTRGV
jgi:hypothetical protein